MDLIFTCWNTHFNYEWHDTFHMQFDIINYGSVILFVIRFISDLTCLRKIMLLQRSYADNLLLLELFARKYFAIQILSSTGALSL